MPTNKNAYLRYKTLDKCFRNHGRKYYFEDLLDEVNNALSYANPETSGVQTRQLRDDLAYMRSESGFSAPIDTIKDGKKAFYRYSDKSYSISQADMSATEAAQLNSALEILSRFEGRPGFEWVGETSSVLSNKFNIKGEDRKVISYETNIDYKGYELITPLFNAIVNKRVLKVKYEPFHKPAFTVIFHPHFLKQYNNRWFDLGYNQEYNAEAWNMPLDRIIDLSEIDLKYFPNTIDWEDWFSDMVGVTRTADDRPVEVKLLFSPTVAPYVITKPLHQTQKIQKLDSGEVIVRINVIPNIELDALINSFGTNVSRI